MARVCAITGKRTIRGNNVAHCNKKVKRSYSANLQKKRFWLESEKRFVRLRVSCDGMRIIDKKGLETVLAEIRQANRSN